MAEAALIGLATDATKGLVQLVAARAMHEINLAWGFKDQLQKLKQKFEYIQAFLEDAGNSRYAHKSKMVNLWLQKVKDAAYSADNVMDEYAIEIFRRKMELKNQWTKKFRNFFTLSKSNPVFFRFRMAHKVEDILSLFDEIDKLTRDIGLRPVDVADKALTNTYSYDVHLGESRQHSAASADFVGREDDQTKLLDVICSLTNEGPEFSTVAIVGMGGLGKTTLARRLYDSDRICAHFSKEKIWINVFENFGITRFLNEMVESVTSRKSELSNTDAILRKLQENLKGKKLLLVLDDVWNDKQDSWDSLKDLLDRIGTVPGSVILITTRGDEVANAAGAKFKHKLEGLSKDESWSLFCHRHFNNMSRPNCCTLEEVGKRIVEKCKGLPLAIKVIRGLLQAKQDLREWESIENSELWDSPHGQDKILPWLLLSFNHLPSSSLKQCFAYYAVIRKGNYVYKSELIGMWLSQGYLRNDERTNLTMEEIGEKNLEILLRNSLFEEYVSKLNGAIAYRMHDLMYDLAVYVCGSDLVKETRNLCETGSCRHLLLNSVENNLTSDVVPEVTLSKLRTLGLKGEVLSWNMLGHTRYLRTLTLDRTKITELPAAVALLKHLRFLDVSFNPISTLPDSIGKLYQLQTLVLQGCTKMKKLPKVVNTLVNLRHVSTTVPMLAWKGLHQLTNLRSFPSLSLDDDGEGWTIDELGYLRELRDEISILGLEYVKDKEQAKESGLAKKANVTKLNLSWVKGRIQTSGDMNDEDVLEGLEPHPNITSLEVQNFIGVKFPTWIMEMAVLTGASRSNRTLLSNLTVAKLLNCTKCHTLPKLGQLPLIKCLILSGLDVESIGLEFYGVGDLHSVPFRCLTELDISGFGRLTTWIKPPKEAFPQLEILRVKDCKQLESVPALGTKSLINLEFEKLDSVKSLDIIKYSSGLISLVMNTLPEIVSLPQELANCTNLQILEITRFSKLISLPMGLESLVSLQSVRVRWCDALNFVMDDLLHICSSLHTFVICGCPSLRKIPSSLEECTSLKTLHIVQCPLTEGSPTNMSKLRRLSELRISCSSAHALRLVLAQDLLLLYRLEISGFRDDNEMGEYFSDMTPFLHLPSLTELLLYGHPNIKTLPQELGLLTRITHLYVWRFPDLEEIPDWIGNLSSLVQLFLEECNVLKSIPSKENLQGLLVLRVRDCPMLVERYTEGASEWHQISHIKWIKMDGKIIHRLYEE